MAKDPLQFFLRKDAGTYYKVSGGVVVPTPTAEPIIDSLADWDKVDVAWHRHKVYHGVFRALSPNTIRFCEDGAQILRYVFNTQGASEAKCEFLIKKLRSTDQLYYDLAVFEIDFSNYHSKEQFVDVQLMEGGASARLNAYDTTNYSIQIGEPQAPGATPNPPLTPVSVLMDGVPFIESFNYETIEGGEVLISDPSLGIVRILGTVFVGQENLFFNGADTFSVGEPQGSTLGIGVIGPPNQIFKFFQDSYIVTMKGEFNINSFSVDPSFAGGYAVMNIYARLVDTDGVTNMGDHLLYDSPPVVPGSTITPGLVSTYPFTIPVLKDQTIVIWFRATGTASTTCRLTLNSHPTKLTLSVNAVGKPQLTACYTQWQLFQLLIANLMVTNPVPPGLVFPLTPADYDAIVAPVKSDLLSISRDPSAPGNWDVDPTQTYYTSGNALRQMQYFGIGLDAAFLAYINTNIKDYVKDAFVSLCAGLGIERIDDVDTYVIEELSHFYRNDQLIADVGSNIKNFAYRPYTDHLGNNIKFGYKNQTYSDANGNFEYNRGLEFSTPVMRSQQDIDMLSPYRGDGWGSEMERINTAGQNSTDASADADVFKFQGWGEDSFTYIDSASLIAPYDKPPYYPPDIPLPSVRLKRNNGITDGLPQIATGLPGAVADRAINIPLTPKRQALRLLRWLKSNYFGILNPVLKYQKSDRKMNLTSDMISGAGMVREWDDIDLAVADRSELYFQPGVVSFETEVPIDLADRMAATPYGVIRFEYIKSKYQRFNGEMFVDIAGMIPGTNNSYSFEGRLSPDTVVPDWV